MVERRASGRRTLPLATAQPAERADAARNRRALLAAADRLVAERGADALTMEAAAAAAGVGVGTVYRRFGDLAGLALALVDEHERRLQAAFLSGPPPLGPGGPAFDRLRAFLHAYVDRLQAQAPLLAVAEVSTPTARYRNGAYLLHQAHVEGLLAELRPGSDAQYLADAVLAPLAAGLFLHQREDRRMSVRRIKAGLEEFLAGFTP